MRQDLDALCSEFEQEAAARSLVVYHGYSRRFDEGDAVFWDVEKQPELKGFLDVAQHLGVRLLVYHQRRMSAEMLEDSFQRLEDSEMPREDRRELEQSLKRFRMYEGFTCALEISFDHEGRTYMYEVQTEWYVELLDVLDELHAYAPPDEEEGEGPVGGGYFSKN